jgi:cobalamin biosynthesis Mg chelatase CobN
VTTSGSATGTDGGTLLASNGTVNTLKNGPVEIVDLDKTQVPLTEYTGEEEGEKDINSEITPSETQGVVRASGMSGPVKMIIGMAVVVIIAGAGWFFLRKVSGSRDE